MPMRHASKTEFEPAAARRVSVLLPFPLGTAYDYRLPPDMTLTPGDFVSVPLGRRAVTGVVWGDGDPAGVADGRLKDMSCRVAMLRMHRDGLIELPAPRRRNGNP